MAAEFNQARKILLERCKEITNIDVSGALLNPIIWTQSHPYSELSNKEMVDIYESGHLVSDDDYRASIRKLSGNYFMVNMAITSRIQLIQVSCSKILNSWNGVSSDLNEFRYIVERYAVLLDILNKLEAKLGNLQIKNGDDLDELHDIVSYSGWTRFNWDKGAQNFEDMRNTDYKHSEDSGKIDLSSKSILSAIDRTERSRMKGLRAFYSFCCEFVHPNLGDVISCSFDMNQREAKDGAILNHYSLSPLSKPSSILGLEFQDNREGFWVNSSYNFANKILDDLKSTIPVMLKVTRQAHRVRTGFIHKLVKRVRVFSKTDICPCGSGLSIKACNMRSVNLKAI